MIMTQIGTRIVTRILGSGLGYSDRKYIKSKRKTHKEFMRVGLKGLLMSAVNNNAFLAQLIFGRMQNAERRNMERRNAELRKTERICFQ